MVHRGQRKVMSGTGVVPGVLLGGPSWKQGVQDLVDTIKVRHTSGGWSVLGAAVHAGGVRAGHRGLRMTDKEDISGCYCSKQ